MKATESTTFTFRSIRSFRRSQYYEMGRRYAQKLVRAVNDAEATTVVTDCPLSALRISKENGVPVMHPVEALAEAYGIRVGDPTHVKNERQVQDEAGHA